jgi:hypothetical protein
LRLLCDSGLTRAMTCTPKCPKRERAPDRKSRLPVWPFQEFPHEGQKRFVLNAPPQNINENVVVETIKARLIADYLPYMTSGRRISGGLCG